MKFTKGIINNILRVIIWMLLGYSRLMGQVVEGQLIDKIIANVDDQPIFYSDLAVEYQLYKMQGMAGKIPTQRQILESLIISKILLANAAKSGIHIKKEEVDRYFNYKMQVLLKEVGTEAQLEQHTGKPIQVFKSELRKFIREQLTLEKMRNSIIEPVTVSPKEVKHFFEQLPTTEIPFYPTMVEAYQLVRYPTIDEQQKEVLIDRLKSLKARIEAGEDFAELAKQYSEDQGSAPYGGELGFFEIGELDPAYEKAALKLLPGEVSEPVETQYGFHIIQLLEKRDGKYNSRHIVLKATPSVIDIEKAVAELDSLRTSILEKQVSFEQAVKKFSQDVAHLQKGGLLTESSEGRQLPITELPRDLFLVIDKMEPGMVSEPMIFTTPTGKQAVRLIYLKEKIPSHQANLEQDYELISKLALNAKKQRVLEEWILQAKEKTTIELDPDFVP